MTYLVSKSLLAVQVSSTRVLPRYSIQVPSHRGLCGYGQRGQG